MTVHNMAAYCKGCMRVQCRCKRDHGEARTMEEYNRWHKEPSEPSDEEKDAINLEICITLINKIAAGSQEEAPQGERFGRRLTDSRGGYARGRTGIRIF